MKKKPSTKRALSGKAVPRREALKGIGALAIAAPSLAAIGCSSDSGSTQPVFMGAGTGAGGTPPASGGAGTAASAAGSTATGTAGSSTGAAGTSSGGAAGSTPMPPAGAAGRTSSMAGRPAMPAAGQGSTAGASGGAAGGSAGTAAPTGGMGAASGGGGSFIPVTFDMVPSCTLTPTDPAGEGPFFLHEDEVMNDMSLMRSNMSEGKPGIEMQLNLRVLDSEGMCMKPISGVEVYVWHTDALGFYSGFNGQDPNKTYSGGIERTVENMDRFCRGIQVTDEMGVVKFRTVYPGWYNGRAIHIHFVALHKGSMADTASYRSKQSMVFTTQMYFQEQFSRMIHENNDPYKTRASGTGYNQYVKPQNMVVVPSTKMEGNVVVASLNIVTAGTGSRR